MKIVFGGRRFVFGIFLFFGTFGGKDGGEGLVPMNRNSLGNRDNDNGIKSNDNAFITNGYNDDDKEDETTHLVDYEYFGGKFDLPYWIVGTVYPW